MREKLRALALDMHDRILCDFCRKAQRDVRLLVESPDRKSHICDECIAVAASTVAERLGT